MKRNTLICLALFNLAVFALLIVRWKAFDYMGFYATGKLSVSNPSLLFNEAAQRAAQSGITVRYLPFLHLPHEVAVFRALSALPLGWSMALWTLINLVCLGTSCWILSKLSGVNAWFLAAALFPVMLCFMQGQDSFLLLFLVVESLWLVTREEEFFAGAVLAVSLFKPQLGLIIAFAMFVNRRWQFFAGFMAGSFSVIFFSVMVYGENVFPDLFALILRSQNPAFQHDMVVEPANYPTLRGLAYLLHAPNILVILASLALIAWCARSWYSEKDPRILFSSAVVAGCLVAFNWHRYDLVVLLIPLAIWPNLMGSKVILFSPLTAVLSYFWLSPLLCIPMLHLVVHYAVPHSRTRRGRWQEHQRPSLAGSSDSAGLRSTGD